MNSQVCGCSVAGELSALLETLDHQQPQQEELLSARTSTTAASSMLESTQSPLLSSSASEPRAKKLRSSLFGYKTSTPETQMSELSAEYQLTNYLSTINSDSFDPESDYNIFGDKNFTRLRPLFSRLFCVPATSAPVERVFSQGGIIMRPHRARLGNELLEMLMYLRCNGN